MFPFFGTPGAAGRLCDSFVSNDRRLQDVKSEIIGNGNVVEHTCRLHSISLRFSVMADALVLAKSTLSDCAALLSSGQLYAVRGERQLRYFYAHRANATMHDC